ncbi:MAG: DUF6431 domain-containing protein [Kiritimatiellia bacterium]
MQLRFSNVPGGVPPACPHCGRRKMHRHGHYWRYAPVDDRHGERISIPRFFCRFCARTCSILPDHLLPYRPVRVERLQSFLDAELGGDTGPPHINEIERGCIQRAIKRLEERVAPLKARLGQMLKAIHPSTKQLWQSFRTWGNLGRILQCLARDFNTSLLWDYRCLQPCRIRSCR